MSDRTLFDLHNPEPCADYETVFAAHRREVATESHRRHAATERMLEALREGPKTNLDLIHICQRISGRIFDLRQRGYVIDADLLEPGIYRYTLRGGRSS